MSVFTFLEKRLEEVIAGIGVVIMCIMVFFQVVMRYNLIGASCMHDFVIGA